MNDYQRKILAYLIQYESMGVKVLGNKLMVSDSTVRRQLTQMEKQGLVVRTHGGVRISSPLMYDTTYRSRADKAIIAKRQISALAMSLISPKQVIGLSGGTTCAELSRRLRALDDITIVTNDINIALEIQSQSRRRIMVTGGFLNQNSYELVGSQVSHSLENVHIDVAFLGASGISADFGFSMSDEPEAVAGRAFINHADRIVILADHTKVGKSTFARLCALNDVDTLITDEQIAGDQLVMLRNAGLHVLIASSKSELVEL
jgi:DeoR family transcriptional regulator, aga operon transcriptional repressor